MRKCSGPKRADSAGETYREPDRNVGVSWGASATSILFISSRPDHNGVLERAYHPPSAIGLAKAACSHVAPSHAVPLREASRGFMSKMSMPCIFPNISNRSKPVACSRSVGMDPTAAPGASRSSSVLISVRASVSALLFNKLPQAEQPSLPSNFLILVSLDPLASPAHPVST
jgi:hypothetical protein